MRRVLPRLHQHPRPRSRVLPRLHQHPRPRLLPRLPPPRLRRKLCLAQWSWTKFRQCRSSWSIRFDGTKARIFCSRWNSDCPAFRWAAKPKRVQARFNYRGYVAGPVIGTPQGLAVYQNGVRINEVFGDIVNWDFIPQKAISD